MVPHVLDIEGDQRTVLDERALPANHLPVGAVEQRVVIRYAYAILGHWVQQLMMEAGARWMLNDVSGQPIRVWDSRGHDVATTYFTSTMPTTPCFARMLGDRLRRSPSLS